MAHLNERQRRIVSIVESSEGSVTGSELARRLGVSVRTVQAEIARINAEKTILLSSNRGYALAVRPDEAASTLPSPDDLLGSALRLIAHKLLIERRELTTDDLSESLYLSRSATERLIREARDELSTFDLQLERRHGRLSIVGSKTGKQHLLSRLVLEEASQSSTGGNATPSSMSSALDLDFVRTLISSCAQEAGHYVEPGHEAGLVASVAIALFQMRSERDTGIDESSETATNAERRVANDICSRYAQKWPIEASAADVAQVTSLLVGRLRPSEPGIEYPPDTTEDTETGLKIEGIVREALEPYGIVVTRTPALHGLVLHVKQLLRRSSLLQAMDHDVLESVKRSYPFIFEIAQIVANALSECFGVKIGRDELGFLCIHLGLVVGEGDTERLRLALLSTTYRSVAKNLRDQLIMRLGDCADIVTYDDAAALSRDVRLGSIDLVVTTDEIRGLSVPVTRVSPLLVSDDVLAIEREALRVAERKRSLFIRSVQRYFSPQLFIRHDGSQPLARDEAIDLLCQRLVSEGMVDDTFEQSVRKRERAGSTCFFERFAIPHALEMNARETSFCVLVSESGVRWDESLIHVVLMIAVRRDDRTSFMDLFNATVKSLSQEGRAETLAHARTLEEFLALLG